MKRSSMVWRVRLRKGGFLERSLLVCLLGCVLVLFMERDVYAYIDPGSGSLMWQLLAATFFGGLFYIKSIIKRIRSWFRRSENE